MKYLKSFNESFSESTSLEEHGNRIVDSLKKQYQTGIDVYKALLKDGGEKAINKRRQEIENYFNENRHIDLQSISRGSREISNSQSSPYYLGSILNYLYKSSFSASFFNMVSNKSVSFDDWFRSEKIEPIIDKISELSIVSESKLKVFNESKSLNYLKHLYQIGGISSDAYDIVKHEDEDYLVSIDKLGDTSEIKKEVLNHLNNVGAISTDVYELEMENIS